MFYIIHETYPLFVGFLLMNYFSFFLIIYIDF